MADQVLSVPVFGGGVALEGSSDAHRTDELTACDGYDIGPRGQLVAASDLSNFAAVQDGHATAMALMFAIEALAIPQAPKLIVVGATSSTTDTAVAIVDPVSATVSPILDLGSTVAAGVNVTTVTFPYVKAGVQTRVALICLGARGAQTPRSTLGMYALIWDGTSYSLKAMDRFDALGTGPDGQINPNAATHSKKLYPRGCVAYNNHVFLFGFDDSDATNGDGPTRLMFSNLANPLKYGNDPTPTDVTTDRAFVDSDALLLGGAGEMIRAGYVWSGKLWVGTNKELHFVEGMGRDSFLANGAIPIKKSRNVVGPKAMIEGPDGLLYGVSDEGLWQFDGAAVEPIGNRVRDFATKSNGWWDCIWTDPARATTYPGQTNQDLVWMVADPETMQVWVVIPWCSISNGYGYGTDTVIIKYHCLTGGFTRQPMPGVQLTAGAWFKRDVVANNGRFIAVPGVTQNLRRYAYKATAAASPALPSSAPDVTFGEYAPFGPNGVGVMRKRYLTIAWEAASALPLVFTLTPTIDGQSMTAVTLTIGATAPGTPADGDLWVDTSGTDTNLGNGTAGAIVPANAADFLVKSWVATWNKWAYVGAGGQQGTRITVPVAFSARRGTRFKLRMQNVSAAGRWQLEGLGEKPAGVREGM